jgi:hypothetical protein
MYVNVFIARQEKMPFFYLRQRDRNISMAGVKTRAVELTWEYST